MWLFFVVLPSVVVATFGNYTFFTDHRNKNLDHTVSPCDNFFKHVCKPNLPYSENLYAKLVERFNDMLKPYEPKIGQILKREIQKHMAAMEIDPVFLEKHDFLGDWEVPGLPPLPPLKTSSLPPTTVTPTSSVQPSTTDEGRTTTPEEPETEKFQKHMAAMEIDPVFLEKHDFLGDWEVPGLPPLPPLKTSSLPPTTVTPTSSVQPSTTDEGRTTTPEEPETEKFQKHMAAMEIDPVFLEKHDFLGDWEVPGLPPLPPLKTSSLPPTTVTPTSSVQPSTTDEGRTTTPEEPETEKFQKHMAAMEIDPVFLEKHDFLGDWEVPGLPPLPPLKTSSLPPTTVTPTSSVQPSTTDEGRTTTPEEPETEKFQKHMGAMEIDPVFLEKHDFLGDWEVPGLPPLPPLKTSSLPPTTVTPTSSVQPSTTDEGRTTTPEEPETEKFQKHMGAMEIDPVFLEKHDFLGDWEEVPGLPPLPPVKTSSLPTTSSPRPTTPGKEKQIDEMLFILCPVFIYYKDCNRPEKFAEVMSKMRNFYSKPSFERALTERVLKGVGTYEAFHRYVMDNPDFLAFQPEFDKLFHYAKSSVMKEIQSTPWIQKKNQKLLQTLEKTSMINNNGNVSIVSFLEAGYKEYNNCPRHRFGRNVFCVVKSMVAIVRPFRELIGDFETYIYLQRSARNFQAMYMESTEEEPPKIYAYPPLVGPFYEGIPETLGSAGAILGHELGHITAEVKTTWPIERKCFEGHRHGVCLHEFQECKSASRTFLEDIADYVSMHAILSLFKEHFPEATKDDYQRLFYAHAYSWCDNGANNLIDSDRHSAHIVRTNGILRLFDEFSEAFDCKKGDFMRTERETRCPPLVGVDAPHSRK